MAWPVLNRFSISRSPVEILLWALLFVGITLWKLFYSMTHYDITMGNNIATSHLWHHNVHDIVMVTYHDVTMHTDVARTLIYNVLLSMPREISMNIMSTALSFWTIGLSPYRYWQNYIIGERCWDALTSDVLTFPIDCTRDWGCARVIIW